MNHQKEKPRKQFHLLMQQQKKIRCLRLAKEIKDLYSENYRILKKEMQEDKIKWKHIPCLLEILNLRWIFSLSSINIAFIWQRIVRKWKNRSLAKGE